MHLLQMPFTLFPVCIRAHLAARRHSPLATALGAGRKRASTRGRKGQSRRQYSNRNKNKIRQHRHTKGESKIAFQAIDALYENDSKAKTLEGVSKMEEGADGGLES